MRTREGEGAVAGSTQGETIEEIRPGREVGWIFRDGDVRAIERQGERTRTCDAPDVSHMPDG
jgi:hypothetical protein